MAIIVILGNPPITEWFYWHYIPEMISGCLFGMWISELQFRWYVIAIPVCVAIGLLVLAFSPTIIISFAVLVIPLFLGYWVQEHKRAPHLKLS